MLEIQRLPNELVAVAGTGPAASLFTQGLAQGAMPNLPAALAPEDHLALLRHDGRRILVSVHGHTHALVLQHDGRHNWVDGGEARFEACQVERVMVLAGRALDWTTREVLKELMQQPVPDPTAVRSTLGEHVSVLVGRQSTDAPPDSPDDLDEDEVSGLFAVIGEIAEIDYRATPEVVRRVASPGAPETTRAFRVGDGLYEAPDFHAPTAPNPLELVLIVDHSAGSTPVPSLEASWPQLDLPASLDPDVEPMPTLTEASTLRPAPMALPDALTPVPARPSVDPGLVRVAVFSTLAGILFAVGLLYLLFAA